MSALTYVASFVTTGVNDWRRGYLCLKNPTGGSPLASAVWALLRRAEQQPGGAYLAVRLDLRHRPRSTGPRSASAHFHGHCQTIAKDTGNDMEDVKMFLKRRAMRRGYPAQTTKDGKLRYSLVDKLPLPQSEADASVEQENWLIEEAHQLAAEEGVTLAETSD